MKREKSSPKEHFILIKTWKNSKHNLEHPVGYSSLCWSQVPAFWLSGRVFLRPASCPPAAGMVHPLNKGEDQRADAIELILPILCHWKNFSCDSENLLLHPKTNQKLGVFLVYLTWWRQYGETKPGSRCFHSDFSRLALDSEVLLAVQRSPWQIK